MAFVKKSLTTRTEIIKQFVENYPNFDKSSKSRCLSKTKENINYIRSLLDKKAEN